MKKIAEQLELSRALPVVVGNQDYRELETRLIRIDELLKQSGLEDAWVQGRLRVWLDTGREASHRKGKPYQEPSLKQMARQARTVRQALRCNVARRFTETECRRFSRRLAESPLLQWFCGIDRVEEVHVPSKSTVNRYETLAPEHEVRALVDRLTRMSVQDSGRLELAKALTMELCLMDSTCLEANIHFPTDWVLLRDGVRTLMKAVKVIRKHGMKHRMPSPDGFLSQINSLCMEMTQGRRRPDSVKRRKRTLRKMKRLTKVVKEHAHRYNQRLRAKWQTETDLHEGEMLQIANRIDTVVALLPKAIRQAHERIIGGRPVENADKLLSLYEPDLHVIVRNKANAEVEFGNTLFLAEQMDGLIVDWKLKKEISHGDIVMLYPSVERVKAILGDYPKAVSADRGFSSKTSHGWLKEHGIQDAICPKDPAQLKAQMENATFRKRQKRRAQTEARVGIIKNACLGGLLRSKGFEHREQAVAWTILAHNLWRIAGLTKAESVPKRQAA